MRPREEVRRELVRQWLAKAEEDYAVSERLLKESAQFLSAIGFHAQQAAEKFIKSLLVRHGVEFPKTHDIEQLLELLAEVERGLAESLRAAAALSPYGVELRYPGDFPEMVIEDARTALRLASQVRDEVCRSLDSYLGCAAP